MLEMTATSAAYGGATITAKRRWLHIRACLCAAAAVVISTVVDAYILVSRSVCMLGCSSVQVRLYRQNTDVWKVKRVGWPAVGRCVTKRCIFITRARKPKTAAGNKLT